MRRQTGHPPTRQSWEAANPFQWMLSLSLFIPWDSGSAARNTSAWRLPAFATSVATMYWARLVYMNPYSSSAFNSNSEIYYQATDELISSTNSTMNASWLLATVHCAHHSTTSGHHLLLIGSAILLYTHPQRLWPCGSIGIVWIWCKELRCLVSS